MLYIALLCAALLWAACSATRIVPENVTPEETVRVTRPPAPEEVAPEFLVVEETDEFFPQTDADMTYRDFTPLKERLAIVTGKVEEFTDMPDGKDTIEVTFGTKKIFCRMVQRSVKRVPKRGTTVTIVGTCALFSRSGLEMRNCRLR